MKGQETQGGKDREGKLLHKPPPYRPSVFRDTWNVKRLALLVAAVAIVVLRPEEKSTYDGLSEAIPINSALEKTVRLCCYFFGFCRSQILSRNRLNLL